MRSGEWQSGICPRCEDLIKKGFAAKKKRFKPLKKESGNTYPKAFKNAKAVFQKLRRIEESDENGNCREVHGKIGHWTTFDGGHYIPSYNLFTCFIPENVWPQQKIKNMQMMNPVTVLEYREFLINKIGIEKVIWLESVHRLPIKYSAIELNMMSDEWQKKIDRLLKEKK